MDRLGALKIFVRAAEAKSFVAAGRELGISASAVGKAIARLEERLGARLIQRSTHRLNLTPEGARFLPRCRRALAEFEAAEEELSSGTSGARGTLRISAPAWAHMLAEIFVRFSATNPDARLEVDFEDRIVDVIGERYDLVFRTGALEDSSFVSRVIGRFAHAIVASPGYLRRHGHPRSPADLAAHDCIHRRRATDGKLEPWPLAGYPLPTRGMIVSTVEGRIAIALRGAGIACVPSPCVTASVQRGELVSLFPTQLRPTQKLHAVWARTPSSLLRAFLASASEVKLPGFVHTRHLSTTKPRS